MAQIINFAEVLNARRAAAVIQQREAAKADRLNARRSAIHGEFADAGRPGILLANIIADVVEAKEAAKAERHRPMPAYCDPTNETRGSKYDATRDLSLVEIAKRMREDIKLAIKAGQIPGGLKVAVRVRHHNAIDMRVTAAPAGMTLWNPAFLRWLDEDQRSSRFIPFNGDRYAPAFNVVMDALKSIRSAYNRDNSDSMSDYFDVRYYGDVGMDGQFERDARAVELAAALSTGMEG